MMPPLLATTVVGSYPQPEWLVDRELLRARLVPRLAASEIVAWGGGTTDYIEVGVENATQLLAQATLQYFIGNQGIPPIHQYIQVTQIRNHQIRQRAQPTNG